MSLIRVTLSYRPADALFAPVSSRLQFPYLRVHPRRHDTFKEPVCSPYELSLLFREYPPHLAGSPMGRLVSGFLWSRGPAARELHFGTVPVRRIQEGFRGQRAWCLISMPVFHRTLFLSSTFFANQIIVDKTSHRRYNSAP